MYENSRFLKNRFTFCGINTNFGQQWDPPAYYHLTPIVSKGKHCISHGVDQSLSEYPDLSTKSLITDHHWNSLRQCLCICLTKITVCCIQVAT